MTANQYRELESYMLSCMKDSAHDKAHIYRVLYVALDIARFEEDIDYDVLVTACLLHDIAREEQSADPSVCHALLGGEKAYAYLLSIGWPEERALHVKDCISSHRYRTSLQPRSIEAKILFDADKIDATGTLGIARTLLYKSQFEEPLYSMLEDNTVSDGSGDVTPSFFQEYRFKLEKLYDKFYTDRGMALAEARRHSAVAFYASMLEEVRASYEPGRRLLKDLLDK